MLKIKEDRFNDLVKLDFIDYYEEDYGYVETKELNGYLWGSYETLKIYSNGTIEYLIYDGGYLEETRDLNEDLLNYEPVKKIIDYLFQAGLVEKVSD